MKLIIAGGRDYDLTITDFDKLDAVHKEHNISLVLSGCATGADTWGEVWAGQRGIQVQHYMPLWKIHGKAAGFMRNHDMALAADALAVFPGGKGTANMLKQAQERGLRVFDFRT